MPNYQCSVYSIINRVISSDTRGSDTRAHSFNRGCVACHVSDGCVLANQEHSVIRLANCEEYLSITDNL